MAFARARRPKQMDDLAALDEVQLGKRQHPGLVERWLEREVEAGERLDRAQASPSPGAVSMLVLTGGQLFEQIAARIASSVATRLDLGGDAAVDDLDGARGHLQANQAGLDAGREATRTARQDRAHVRTCRGVRQAMLNGFVDRLSGRRATRSPGGTVTRPLIARPGGALVTLDQRPLPGGRRAADAGRSAGRPRCIWTPSAMRRTSTRRWRLASAAEDSCC